MSTAAPASLIMAEANPTPDDAQLSFFSDREVPKIDRSQREFNCTGERLFRDRPDVYKLAVRLLAEPGLSWRMIMQTCHMSYTTLVAVAERERVPVETQKKEILGSVRRGLKMCAERVEELAPTMSARDALVGVGILGEKMQLLGGDVTARLEVTQRTENVFDGMRALYEQLQATTEKIIEAQVVSSELATDGPDIGLPAENSEQTAGAMLTAPAERESAAE